MISRLTACRLPHNLDRTGQYQPIRGTTIQFAPPQHVLPNQREANGHSAGVRKRRKTVNPLSPKANAQQTPPSDFSSSAPPSATLPSQAHAQSLGPRSTQNQEKKPRSQAMQSLSKLQMQGTQPPGNTLDQTPASRTEDTNSQLQRAEPSHTYTPVDISPSFQFSPLPQSMSLTMTPAMQRASSFENQPSFPYGQRTPGAGSTNGSVHTDGDKDPFLTLLEQLAENEHSQGGPSELDYFLGDVQG
jgi:hypothetical protein